MPKDNASLFSCFGKIKDALIGGTAKPQREIAERFFITPVHQDIGKVKN